MNKQKLFRTLGNLSLLASFIMIGVGSTNGHLTELLDYFWIPLPLGLIFLSLAKQGGGKDKGSGMDSDIDVEQK